MNRPEKKQTFTYSTLYVDFTVLVTATLKLSFHAKERNIDFIAAAYIW